MKFGNVTALPICVQVRPNMPCTIVATHAQMVGTSSCLKASIGNKTYYYPTFTIFLYLQNHLHIRTRFDVNYCIILSVIQTHSHS